MSTEEEIRLIKAYNIGHALSAYEPKLLEQIIKNNKNNEFVKTMGVARDHAEFEKGIPRKDFTQQYRNGFKNARSLAEHQPQLLDKMIVDKELNKDFVKGLEAGKKEYKIQQSMARIKQERQQAQQQMDRDLGMEL